MESMSSETSGSGSGAGRPPRLRPLSADVIANTPAPAAAVSDAELYSRLEDALAALPAAERAAAVLCYGLDEGPAGVAGELGLDEDDADALARSALQLLRGALAGADSSAPTADAGAPVVRRSRRIGNHRPGDTLEPGR